MQGTIVPFFYLGSILYTIFYVKGNKDMWVKDEEYAISKGLT